MFVHLSMCSLPLFRNHLIPGCPPAAPLLTTESVVTRCAQDRNFLCVWMANGLHIHKNMLIFSTDCARMQHPSKLHFFKRWCGTTTHSFHRHGTVANLTARFIEQIRWCFPTRRLHGSSQPHSSDQARVRLRWLHNQANRWTYQTSLWFLCFHRHAHSHSCYLTLSLPSSFPPRFLLDLRPLTHRHLFL